MSLTEKKLNQRIANLRWLAILVVLALVTLHQLFLHVVLERLVPTWRIVSEIIVYGLTGVIAVWMGLTWLAQAVRRHEQVEAELRTTHQNLERAQHQLLVLREIGLRAAQAQSPQELLELVAQAPLRLIDARGTTVHSFDERTGNLNLDIAWGLSDEYVAALRGKLEKDGVACDCCAGCQALQARLKDGDCPLFDGLQRQTQAENIGSVVCLPLAYGERRVGMVNIYLPTADAPTEEQLQPLNVVAAGVTAGLEGIRLRRREMNTLFAVDRATQVGRDLDTLLNQVLAAMQHAWGADEGAILLYETETHSWTCPVWLPEKPSLTDPASDLALSIAEASLETSHPLIIPDLRHDPRWDGANQTLVSALGLPFIVEGEPLGVLFLGARRSDAFGQIAEAMLSMISHQVGLVVQNARLYARLEQVTILEERQRLSRELHDGLAQNLAYLGLMVERAEQLLGDGRTSLVAQELTEIRRAIRDTYNDLREAIDGLRLRVDHPGGIVAALKDYVDDFATRTGIEIDFNSGDLDRQALSPVAETQLLRIAQEALTNAHKHARARRVRLRLSQTPDHLELVIADDGQGFEPVRTGTPGHYGLSIMRERAESLGGQCTLATGQGQGTRVTVRLPLMKRGNGIAVAAPG